MVPGGINVRGLLVVGTKMALKDELPVDVPVVRNIPLLEDGWALSRGEAAAVMVSRECMTPPAG